VTTPRLNWDNIDFEERNAQTAMQASLLRNLGWTFVLTQLVTVPAFLAVLFLDGFGTWGFDLSDAVIMFVGGVTVSETAGLITVSITSFLKTSD